MGGWAGTTGLGNIPKKYHFFGGFPLGKTLETKQEKKYERREKVQTIGQDSQHIN